MLEDFPLGSAQAKDHPSLGDSCLLKQGNGEAELSGFLVALSNGTKSTLRTHPHGMNMAAFEKQGQPEAR